MTRARPDLAQPPAVAKIAAVIYGREVRRLLAGRLNPDTEARIYDLARAAHGTPPEYSTPAQAKMLRLMAREAIEARVERTLRGSTGCDKHRRAGAPARGGRGTPARSVGSRRP